MEIRPDAWLSAVIGQDAFQVIPQGAEQANSFRETLLPHLRMRQRTFYYVRIGIPSPMQIHELSSLGFFGVDVGLTLERSAGEHETEAPPPAVAIRPITPAQHERVLEIAGTCFRYSRFHADPLIPVETAHRIKREWVGSYLRGERGGSLHVAVVDSEPAGFLAAMDLTSEGRKIRVVDLIGVRPDLQRRGVGRALVSHFVRQSRGACDRIRVGTQLTNLPSLRLYSRMDFLIAESQYVMHMHVRNGSPCFDIPCA